MPVDLRLRLYRYRPEANWIFDFRLQDGSYDKINMDKKYENWKNKLTL